MSLVNVAPVPEVNTLFPIIGFLAVAFSRLYDAALAAAVGAGEHDVVWSEPDWR